MTTLLQTPTFKRAIKRLHKDQKRALDDAVRAIAAELECGEPKIGDLAGVRVYKFRMNKQLTLLAYEQDENNDAITLLTFGSHENFYRDMKR